MTNTIEQKVAKNVRVETGKYYPSPTTNGDMSNLWSPVKLTDGGAFSNGWSNAPLKPAPSNASFSNDWGMRQIASYSDNSSPGINRASLSWNGSGNTQVNGTGLSGIETTSGNYLQVITENLSGPLKDSLTESPKTELTSSVPAGGKQSGLESKVLELEKKYIALEKENEAMRQLLRILIK